MAELKTKVNDASVEAFLNSVPDARRRADAFALLRLMTGVTRTPAKMWGTSIVGFGQYHYVYGSGREGDMCLVGFSPRAQALTVYIMPGFAKYKPLLAQLGPCKTSVSCLYIKRLADVDMAVLRELVAEAYRHMKATYGRPVSKGRARDPRPGGTKPSAR